MFWPESGKESLQMKENQIPFNWPHMTGKELYYNLSLWSAYNVMLLHTVLP